MAQLERAGVAWHGLLPSLARFVQEWRPPALSRETQYRDHLLASLRAAVPDGTKVEKEYRHLGTTLDLWMQWSGILSSEEICFELKVKLSRKTDFDRLVGQIEGINPRKNQLLIVLIGDTEPSLLERLKTRYRELLQDDLARKMAIVCVPVEM